MEVFKTVNDVIRCINEQRTKGFSIGFVPTMGALHRGHISLLDEAKKECDITVVSIFVNPTQFNDKQDYIKYPRNIEDDLKILSANNCDIVFIPSEKEIYPKPDNRIFDLGHLEKIMEGEFRAGHFQGVAKVVNRLFSIIKPDIAFFGKKDFQQLAVIKRLVEIMDSSVKIIGCPILREENGLAMSSRNKRLSEEEFNQASVIYKTISHFPEWVKEHSLKEIKKIISTNINSVSGFNTEYVEIIDSESLEPISAFLKNKSITCCVAVYCRQVRLIDNIQINL
jgi:pantoate--beta-alanine ligase